MHNSIPSISFAIFSGFFQHKYCGLIFCFATLLTTKCSATILRLNFAKLQRNFTILSQNCNWIFSLISSPEEDTTVEHLPAKNLILSEPEGPVLQCKRDSLDHGLSVVKAKMEVI